MTIEADHKPRLVAADLAPMVKALRTSAAAAPEVVVSMPDEAALVLARMIERDLAPRPQPVILFRDVPDGWALRVCAVATAAGWTHTVLAPLGRLIAGWIHG